MLQKSKTKQFVAGLLGASLALSLAFAVTVKADTVSDLTAQINSLLSTISGLQSQLATIQGGSSSTATTGSYTFSTNLTLGSSGVDVMNLQKVLNMSADTQVASGSSAGASGHETSKFGPATKAAVIKFQTKYGISPAAGYVGAITRAKLNTMSSGSTTTTTTTTSTVPGCTSVAGFSPTTGQSCSSTTVTTSPAGTGLTISVPTQPAVTLAPNGAARVPFTKITLTAGNDGDVTVNSLTVQRTGLAADAAFASVSLLDENGIQIGIAKTLNSNHQATIGDPIVVKAGTSRTLTVAGNMPAKGSSYSGQVATLTVVGVNTSATVSGSLPVTGSAQTINTSLVLGEATPARGALDPNADITKEIGTTGYTFSSVKVTAGSKEQIVMNSIRWNQSGSASPSDLANITTYVDGTAYPTVVSSDGKYYTANFGTGIVIDKGLAKEISIKGDIVSGTTRKIAFDLYKSTDLSVTGGTYGYGITPKSDGASGVFGTTNPWFNASEVTVSAGTMSTISQSNAVPAQNIAVLAPNQPLGGFAVKIRGEAITVQQMVFNITAAGDQAENITNISLVDGNGSVVAGPVDAVSTATDSAYGTVTFTDTVTFPVGDTTLKLVGQLGSSFTVNDTVQASTTPYTQWTTVTGQGTGDTVSLLAFNSIITGNLMTVKTGALAISVSTQPTARTVIAGATGFEFARYVLDAGQSGEDVRLTNFKALLALSVVTAPQLSNCNLYAGTTNVTDATNVTLAVEDNTFTFNNGGLTVPKGTQKSLSMKCDLSAGATSGNVKWGLADNSTSYTSATGYPSGITVAETMTATAGQQMTASTHGSYTVTNDSALLYKVAQAGTTGVTLANLRFTAGASEALNLKQIALKLGNTASNSPADLVGERVTIWNGITQIGSAQFGGAIPDYATSTMLSPAPTVAAGESMLITIKGDLSAQNINEGTPGAFLAITYDGGNNGVNGNYATGESSQASIPGGTTSDVTTNGLRIFRTVPTIAVTSNGGALAPGGDLYKFTVTNGNSRDVVFKKFSFSVATTGGATTGFTLYGDGVAANGSAVDATREKTNLGTGVDTVKIIIDATSQAKIVPANSTKTYILKANTVVDTASVAETINLALLADTAYPALEFKMGTSTGIRAINVPTASSTNNIVWSPFSTTTPVADAASEVNLDWTNGYGLPGFPANADFPIQTWTRPN